MSESMGTGGGNDRGKRGGRLFDDLAGVASGAFSALAGVRAEVEAAARSQVEALVQPRRNPKFLRPPSRSNRRRCARRRHPTVYETRRVATSSLAPAFSPWVGYRWWLPLADSPKTRCIGHRPP